MLFGGLGDDGKIYDDVWVYYGGVVNCWKKVVVDREVGPGGRYSHVGVRMGDEGVLVWGGIGTGVLDGRVWRFRLVGDGKGVWEGLGVGPKVMREGCGGCWVDGRLVLMGGEGVDGDGRGDFWMGVVGEGLKVREVRRGLQLEVNALPRVCGHCLVKVGKYLLVWGGVVEGDSGSGSVHDVWTVDLDKMVSWRVYGIRGKRRALAGVCYVDGYGILEFGGGEDSGVGELSLDDEVGVRLYDISEKKLEKYLNEVCKMAETLEKYSDEDLDEGGLRDGDGRLKEGAYLVGHVVQSCEVGHWVEVFVDGERYVGMLMTKKVNGSLESNARVRNYLDISPSTANGIAPAAASTPRASGHPDITNTSSDKRPRPSDREETIEAEARRKRLKSSVERERVIFRERQRARERTPSPDLEDYEAVEAKRQKDLEASKDPKDDDVIEILD